MHYDSKGVHILLTCEVLHSVWSFRRSIRKCSSWRVNIPSWLSLPCLNWILLCCFFVISFSEINDFDEEILNYNDIAGGKIKMSNLVLIQKSNSIRKMRNDMHFGWESKGLLFLLHLLRKSIASNIVHQ